MEKAKRARKAETLKQTKPFPKVARAVPLSRPSRPDDKVGIAAAYARVGNNARGLDADIGLFGHFFYPVRSGETMIEMMYQAQLAPWWTLQPELQYIIQPGGGVLNANDSLRSNAWVIGLRSSLNF